MLPSKLAVAVAVPSGAPEAGRPAWTTSETFDDGRALYIAVCELRFEGVVAKNHWSLYRLNDRGWVKVKNPNYWRRDGEPEAISRKHEPRARTLT